MDGIHVVPATAQRWPDLVSLFGENGASAGCWCMWHRLTGRDAEAGARAGGECNRRRLQVLVEDGRNPGLLAYRGAQPVGWVALAPRQDYGRVERSAFARLSPSDGTWAIVCFFIHRAHRRRGVAQALLQAAIAYAEERGARTVEAYPVDSTVRPVDDASAYHGVASMFRAAGFAEVARPFPARPLMRRTIRAVET